ncbi:hypothetical protein [Mesorhizobium sp. M0768]|uniref:hypothetical protein n=1 Tax=unclassified Mesorhizobium TaxID=325217 RepID=UPI0033390655
MRTISLILALVMQSVITVSLAQDAKTPFKRPAPEEHKDFVAEIEGVFRKYPKAIARYKLVDIGLVNIGEMPRVECTVECEFDSTWGGWCKDRCDTEREE